MKDLSVSELIANKFLEKGVIAKEDMEIYAYGLWLIFAMLLNTLSTLAIGIIMHMVSASLLFLLFYIPLRRYAGGYHARTPGRCYVYSMFMVVVLLWGVKRIDISLWISVGIIAFLGITLCCIGPVEDSNKPLDDKEKKRFGQKAIIIYAIESVVWIVSVVLKQEYVKETISWSFLMLVILMWAGFYRNHRIKEKG